MTETAGWNPLTDWKDVKIDWVRVDISPEDLRRFTKRSDFKGLCQSLGFLLLIALGQWFLTILVTFAPFYGAGFLHFVAGTHQHAACEPNTPDFRVSCGDAILDPFSSFIYWHMEYHIEHHMFAAIPCYNLKKFSRFVADQLPPKEHAIPRLLKLHKLSAEKYGSWQFWRDNFGFYKGF